MTIGQKIAWDDTILPFQLESADIRGRVARLSGVLEGVLRQHDYPTPVEALIAEMTLLTALIGQTLKLQWKLSLQVQTNGPVRMIATDYYGPEDEGEPARIRGYASFDPDRITDADPFEQLGNGYFAIMLDQGKHMEPYKGITPISGGSLAACAEAYFAQSEQLPTSFALSFGQSRTDEGGSQWRGGGVMIQHMPKASPFATKPPETDGDLVSARDLVSDDDAENWNRANVLLNSVEDLELVGPSVSSDTLLLRLFNQEDIRVYDAQPVRFGCTCSEDRVRQTMSIYSSKDIHKMTAANGLLTADCQFCGAHYELDPKSLGFDSPDRAANGE